MPTPELAEPIRVAVRCTFSRVNGIAIYERINPGTWKRVASRADGMESFSPVDGRIRLMQPGVENWSPVYYDIRDKILRYCIQFGIDMPYAEDWYRRRRLPWGENRPTITPSDQFDVQNASGANNYPMMWPPTYSTSTTSFPI